MKPLTSTKLTKEQKKGLGDWISAAEQATDEGRNEFLARQRKRMEIAQADREEATSKVRTIKQARK